MKRLIELKGSLTLHFKLLAYFLLFGAIILVLLWVFQSFLLKPYYTVKKSKIVEESATRIVTALHSMGVVSLKYHDGQCLIVGD